MQIDLWAQRSRPPKYLLSFLCSAPILASSIVVCSGYWLVTVSFVFLIIVHEKESLNPRSVVPIQRLIPAGGLHLPEASGPIVSKNPFQTLRWLQINGEQRRNEVAMQSTHSAQREEKLIPIICLL